jgi:hypothetical protein
VNEMANKTELQETIKTLTEENKSLKEGLEESNVKVVELEEALAEAGSTIKELEKSPGSKTAKKEVTVKMVWVHPVVIENGTLPSVFGKKLTANKTGHYTVDVPKSNVKSELGRAGKRLMTVKQYDKALAEEAEAKAEAEKEEE